MSRSSEAETTATKDVDVEATSQSDFLSELPGEVEMSLFDHLEELRIADFLFADSRSAKCDWLFHFR